MCTYEAVLKMGLLYINGLKRWTFHALLFLLEENARIVRHGKTGDWAFLTPFSARISKVVYTPEKNVHVRSGFEKWVLYSPGF